MKYNKQHKHFFYQTSEMQLYTNSVKERTTLFTKYEIRTILIFGPVQ